MPDVENVIKGLKYLHDVKRWSSDESEESITARRNITGDAIALLKAQEPVAPELQSGGNYVCGACGVYTVGFMHPLTGESVQTWKYCGSCGKKVEWDA